MRETKEELLNILQKQTRRLEVLAIRQGDKQVRVEVILPGWNVVKGYYEVFVDDKLVGDFSSLVGAIDKATGV